MTDTKHTPGPWRVLNHSWSDTSIIAPGFDHGVCRLDINHATEESQQADEDQMAANARLIASAPELWEALKTLCTLAPQASSTDWNVAFNAGHAAIAKATQEQPK